MGITKKINLTTNFRFFAGILSVLCFFGFAFGANPDSFIVSVDPATFDINQSVDLTIKAVTKDGSIVNDYQGMVMIEIEELLDNEDSYELPGNNGIYTFSSEDQGVKTRYQGLKIKEEGKFTLKVRDISDDTIVGTQILIVGNGGDLTGAAKGIADILTPISGETVNTPVLNLMGKSDIVNSLVQIYINGQQIEDETETDINGNYSTYIKDLQEGTNKMFVRLVDVNGKILAESDEIEFVYQPISVDDFFKFIDISPSKDVAKNTKVTYKIEVGSSIKDVQLKIGTMFLPMDKSTDGSSYFTKETTMSTEGVLPISLTMIGPAGEKKTYNNVDYIKVGGQDTLVTSGNNTNTNTNTDTNTNNTDLGGVSISNVKVVRDNLTNTQATISRNTNGDVSGFEILYGMQSDNLDKSYTTSDSTATIAGLDANTQYYFQIVPTNDNGDPVGPASSVVGSEAHGSAGTTTSTSNCIVGGISLSTIKIGSQYFLTRGAVAGATKYVVYRSDSVTTSTNNMQKAGETTDTKFQYPFDPNIDKDARYAVQANCSDGTVAQVDSIKKVKVGPAENVIFIVLVSVGAYYFNRRFKWIGN